MTYLVLLGLLGNIITFELSTDVSALHFINEGCYQKVMIEDHLSIGSRGEPDLPAISTRIALPYGMKAEKISLESCTYEILPGNYNIFPVTPILCGIEIESPLPLPNEDIYSINSFFPENPIEIWHSGHLWGFPLASCWIRPVQWNPVTGQVRVLTSAVLSVELDNSGSIPVKERTFWSENVAGNVIRTMVINPEDVYSSGASIVPTAELNYGQYVIVTVPEYLSPMQDLAEWKTAKGIPTTVHTTDWIQSEYSQSDLQRSVRAFLTDCREMGVDFVLISGDNDVFEARFTYPFDDIIPSDLYYADNNDLYPGEDLWDSNRNGLWGEMEDNLDWHPDLWVGRASVNSLEEAEIFIEKVLLYERAPSALNNQQFSSDEMCFGYSTGYLRPGLDPGSTVAESISTIVPEFWSELKCYESEGTNSTSLTVEMINSGPDQLFHLNHGAPTEVYTNYGDLFTTDDILSLQNISESGNVSVLYSMSCDAGAFDTLTCCADAWLNAPMGGGFACMNARPVYMSATIAMGMEFYSSFLENSFSNLGIAHGLSVDCICPSTSVISARIAQGNNLFGDPELPLWFEKLGALSVEYPASIQGSGLISIKVRDSNGSPVEEARICMQKGNWQTGDIYSIGYTDGNGEAVLDIDPQTLGEAVLTVVALNHDPFQIPIPITEVEYSQGNDPSLGFESNPAVGLAEMYFSIPNYSNVKISIYDITGRVSSVPVSGNYQTGTYSLTLKPLNTGIYFARLESGTLTLTQSFTVLE